MKFHICILTVVSILAYPATITGTVKSTNIVVWQCVLSSILSDTNQPDISEINDMNGDSIVDVRDLCIIVNMIKNNNKLPSKSETMKNNYFCINILRDKLLLRSKHFNNKKIEISQLNDNWKNEISIIDYHNSINFIETNESSIIFTFNILPLRC